MTRILITGAAGFVGRAAVHAARAEGAEVVTLTRSAPLAQWDSDTGITSVQIDLGEPSAKQALISALDGVQAVIHAAASFAGDAAAHERNTVGATQTLVDALTEAGAQARLVLVSSLSVYDVAALSDNDELYASIRMIENAEQRDAYAAAKLAQEARVRRYQGPKQILRPGAIYGPHHLWSAQLGFAKAGRVITPGGHAAMPAISVDRTATGLVRAALGAHNPEPVNLIDPNPPTQTEWITALGMPALPVPRGLVQIAGSLLGRGPAWAARFRPLRYDTKPAEALIGPDTEGFAARIADYIAQERAGS